MTEDYNNLETAMKAAKDTTSSIYKMFILQHQLCGPSTVTPVKITHQIQIKCNECT